MTIPKPMRSMKTVRKRTARDVFFMTGGEVYSVAPMPPTKRRLVLFDIDGTLITDDGAARNAFAEGLAEIYDVRCGVPHGATTIAIASGKTPAEKLRAENPDHFFDSAENLNGILAAIRG